jgi:hypothetical protein
MKLTKKLLIKVVANLQDSIKSWEGWGFSQEEEDLFCKIGRMCGDECNKNKDWDIGKEIK